MYLSKFIMPLFTSTLPTSFCARIFDIFFFENEKIIFRAMLAIMRSLEPQLMDKHRDEEVVPILSQPYKHMNGMTADKFIDICHSFRFSHTLLTKLDYNYSMRHNVK